MLIKNYFINYSVSLTKLHLLKTALMKTRNGFIIYAAANSKNIVNKIWMPHLVMSIASSPHRQEKFRLYFEIIIQLNII